MIINPYEPPKDRHRHVLRTPLVAPLSVFMVCAIYLGYTLYFFSGEEANLFSRLKSVSFEIFLFCELALLLGIMYNKKQLDRFLRKHPVLDSKSTLEHLKPILRTNMYSALVTLVMMALGSLTAIVSLLNNGVIKGIVVAVLIIAVAIIMHRYTRVEERLKHIKCTDPGLADEWDEILECWLHKPLPKF